MDKKRVISLTNKIKKALEDIEISENISISYNTYFSKYEMKLNLNLSENNLERESLNLELSRKYGFTQNIVGMEFISPSSGLFRITGFKTRNRKYPILAIRVSDGSQYKFAPYQILSYIGGEKIVNRNANLDKLLDII